jgi:peptide/nickel transport system substrate-binding protein
MGALGALFPRLAFARGRTPLGGRVSLRLPWSLASIDPHRLDDPAAAFFAEALFDTLYARDEGGAIVPALAESDPEPEGASLRVRLRGGLKTAKGRTFTTKDAAASLARARNAGAKGWLADIPVPKDDGRALVFATRDAGRLLRALASPIVAMVPVGFAPDAPDGTGPFKLVTRDDATVLVRNALAARGPAYLDEVVVRTASTLKASLLSFESGTDDLGWLGDGLHEPRPGSRKFDLGAVAWPVLFTGRDANQWDVPGIAQRLCDEIPQKSLAHLQIGAAWPTEPEQGWGGPPVSLYVREDSQWLIELAQAIAARITRPGHEVAMKTTPAGDLAQRRASRLFGLALDVVRPIASGSLGAFVALTTADNVTRAADVVRHPPKLGDVSARTLTRTLRCGVVGDRCWRPSAPPSPMAGRPRTTARSSPPASAAPSCGAPSRSRRSPPFFRSASASSPPMSLPAPRSG